VRMSVETLSPELRGGGGYSFEDAVTAIYLTALLTETGAPGAVNGRIVKVTLQGAASGEPMDDVIVHVERPDGTSAKLALQVKRNLVVSAARTNTDFRAIILAAAETIGKNDFCTDVDQVGVATGTISTTPKRDLIFVCEFARGSEGFESFYTRLIRPGFASEDRRGIFNDVSTILSQANYSDPDRFAYTLLRHFILIEYDLLHPGATDEASAIGSLSGALRPEAAGTATELWNRLKGVAREGAPLAATYTRAALIQRLGGSFKLIGAPSSRRTLRLLEEETRNAVQQIPNQIGGRSYPRDVPLREAAASTAVATYLVGLPGCGKSAIMRSLIEECLIRGPVLFLKSDRLQGRSWRSYAAGMNFDDIPLGELLTELANVGDGVIFIDGIDRVEIENRNIILDVLMAALESCGQPRIRVIITVRGNEFDPLQNWLPKRLLTGSGTKIISVEAFNDAECSSITEDFPALRPLLFGGDRLQEIARRPFFTAVLAKLTENALPSLQTALSEGDLASSWWNGGGMAAEGGARRYRQGVLLELARRGATTLGRRMRTEGLDSDTLVDLVADGLIREVRLGHSVTFTHDIFFEWAFLQLLIQREDDWLATVVEAGEPPALGRAVELLSQWTLEQGEDWTGHYAQLDRAGIRSQWRRAWLVGPFDSPSFAQHAATVTGLLFKGDGILFERLVLWFQAERARPNPLILSGEGAAANFPNRQRIRFADDFAWPSDVLSWKRFLTYLIETRSRQSVRTMPAIIEAFGVWQNLFLFSGLSSYLLSDLSQCICQIVDEWLSEIENFRYSDRYHCRPGKWQGLSSEKVEAIEVRLRQLLLTAGRREAERISGYLEKVSRNKRLAHDAFDQITVISELLIQGRHAARLREVTFTACVDDLPEEEHTRRIGDRGSYFIGEDFSDCHWDSLSVGQLMSLSPATPDHEPFRSLFRHTPDEGRILVRSLTNHAITAWKQLHRFSNRRQGTPIPVRLEWPWGAAEYWGNDQTYCWPRGTWGPGAVGTGLMALEAWALEQLRNGRPVDDIIYEVVEGHESNAVLSIAVMLALTDGKGTLAASALVACQRVWRWDERRFRENLSGSANLIGFEYRGESEKVKAVKALNDLPAQKLMFSYLASCVVLRDSEAATIARAAMECFADHLPYDLVEEREDPKLTEKLREQAIHYAAFADLKNYSYERTPEGNQIQIFFNNPQANEPGWQEQVRDAERQSALLGMAIWASGCLDRRVSLPRAEYEPHLRWVMATSGEVPDSVEVDEPVGHQKAAVGVAAACLAFGKDLRADEVSWCKARVFEAAAIPVTTVAWMIPNSIPLFDLAGYAANGLAGLVHRGGVLGAELDLLLRACIHPNDEVAKNAILATVGLHAIHPRLAWSGLLLLLRRVVVPVRSFSPQYPEERWDVERSRMESALAEVLEWFHGGEDSFRVYELPATLELDEEDSWTSSVRTPRDAYLRHNFLGKVVQVLPWEAMVADSIIGVPTLGMLERLVVWTVGSMQPSGGQRPRQRSDDRRITELMMWGHHLYTAIACTALVLPVPETQRRFLDPIFVLPDAACFMLLRRFVSNVSARGVMDPRIASAAALTLLLACAERTSQAQELQGQNNNKKLWSDDLRSILKDLFFISIDDAPLAARFANGIYEDLPRVLPIVEKIATSATTTYFGLSSYLTLCERSVALFPTEPFIRLISDIFGEPATAPRGWIGTSTPGQIAALIHDLAERDNPVSADLARRMLVILDALVDIGDRRSAALQASQIFREVRVI